MLNNIFLNIRTTYAKNENFYQVITCVRSAISLICYGDMAKLILADW
jgi:hypothetical protein